MSAVACILCGGDHDPGDLGTVCSLVAMDEQIDRMTPRRWNLLTGMVMRKRNATIANAEASKSVPPVEQSQARGASPQESKDFPP